MSLYRLKPGFQSLLRPVVRRLHATGVTANQVTLVACATSVALGATIALAAADTAWFLLLPPWFALRMALNAIDGMLAREHGQASTLGAHLNELADVVSDAALYLPFAFVPGSSPALVAAAIFLATLSETTGILGQALGGSRRYDGPLGKSDRALVFGALGLLLGLGIAPGPWLVAILAAVVFLLVLTTLNRVRRSIEEIGVRGDA